MSRVLKTYRPIITNGFSSSHGGCDVVGEGMRADGIIAHSDGTVVFCQTGRYNSIGSRGNSSYGNCVKIRHGNGCYTLYAHMKTVNVSYSETVKRGQVIGYMGDSGNAYGVHLHFELRDKNDVRMDPAPYLDADLPGGASYKTGSYKVGCELLNVRKGPSTAYSIRVYDQLTDNAKEQMKKLCGGKYNGYVRGMIFDVYEISGNWGKTPSGWVCLDYCTAA